MEKEAPQNYRAPHGCKAAPLRLVPFPMLPSLWGWKKLLLTCPRGCSSVCDTSRCADASGSVQSQQDGHPGRFRALGMLWDQLRAGGRVLAAGISISQALCPEGFSNSRCCGGDLPLCPAGWPHSRTRSRDGVWEGFWRSFGGAGSADCPAPRTGAPATDRAGWEHKHPNLQQVRSLELLSGGKQGMKTLRHC